MNLDALFLGIEKSLKLTQNLVRRLNPHLLKIEEKPIEKLYLISDRKIRIA